MAATQYPPETCDVLVVGGGVAGWCAAMGVCAAKAEPVLIERSGRLGGKAAHAMVGTICGAYLRSSHGEPRSALGKWTRYITDVLIEMGDPQPQRTETGLWFQPYTQDVLEKCLTVPMVRDQLNTRMNTSVLACRESQEGIEVRTRDRSGEHCIRPRAVVDATGNALMTELLGGALLREDRYQAPSHVVHVTGLKATSENGIEATAHRALLRARDKGDTRADGIKHIGVVHGSLRGPHVGLKVTLDHRIVQDDDLQALSERGRSAALAVVQLLREGTDTFSHATVAALAPELGVRTQQRPVGREVLTEDHVLGCRKPTSGVAMGAWPIEHWGDGRSADMQWMPEDDFYLIPSGVLCSSGSAFLFFAGRCISATEMAIASARVMGTCMSTGFAAGVLAAYKAQGKREEDAVEMLRRTNLPEWVWA